LDVTRAQLSRNGIEVLNGLASFTGPNGIPRLLAVRGQADYQAEKNYYRHRHQAGRLAAGSI